MRTPIHSGLTAVLILFPFLAPLAAQGIQISGETQTVLGVHASTTSTPIAKRQLPKATKFTTSIQVKATSGASWAEAKAGIAGGKATVRVSGVAGTGGFSGAHTDTQKLTGSPKVRFVFKSATPVRGRMFVVMKPKGAFLGWRNLATSEATVKVGNHEPASASLFFSVPSVTREYATVLNSTGTPVDVSVTVSGVAYTNVTYAMDVEISFVPGHLITSFGENCADLHTSFPNQSTIDLNIQGVLPASPTLFSVGFRKVNLTIGWPGCKLLVDPVVIVPGPKTDQGARARLRLPLPNENFRVLVQGGIHEPWLNILQLTNGVEIVIVKR